MVQNVKRSIFWSEKKRWETLSCIMPDASLYSFLSGAYKKSCLGEPYTEYGAEMEVENSHDFSFKRWIEVWYI